MVKNKILFLENPHSLLAKPFKHVSCQKNLDTNHNFVVMIVSGQREAAHTELIINGAVSNKLADVVLRICLNFHYYAPKCVGVINSRK